MGSQIDACLVSLVFHLEVIFENVRLRVKLQNSLTERPCTGSFSRILERSKASLVDRSWIRALVFLIVLY